MKMMKEYSKTMKNKMLSITAVLNRKAYRHMLELAQFVQENFDVYKKLKCEKKEVEQCKVTYSNCDEIEVLHDNNKCIVKRIFKQIVSEIH